MKNIFKIIGSTVLLALVVLSCATNDDGKFNNNPETGWVEFSASASTTGQTVTNIQVPIDVEVPIYKNGLTISYTLEPVQGDFTQFVTSSSGTAFADPVDNTRNNNISIDLVNMDIGRDFVTMFDIVLTAVDNSGVSVGIDDASIIRHTVTIPCSNPDVLPADYFVGNYTIADVDATTGPGNGTQNFATNLVTLTVDPTNPNRRLFSTAVLPAFNANAEDIVLDFSTDDIATLAEVVDPGLSCGGGILYIFSTDPAGTPWDICNDQTITIQYTEDPNSSCGGPFESSFILTKVN